MKQLLTPILVLVLLFSACTQQQKSSKTKQPKAIDTLPNKAFKNVIDYHHIPTSVDDKHGYVFSDNGAWFGFGLPSADDNILGFSGPFLMTQENGVWLSPSFIQMKLTHEDQPINCSLSASDGYASHLEQSFTTNNNIGIQQKMFYLSEHTAVIQSTFSNTGSQSIQFDYNYYGEAFSHNFTIDAKQDNLSITSGLTSFKGTIQAEEASFFLTNNESYQSHPISVNLEGNSSLTTAIFISFSEDEVPLPNSSELSTAFNTKVTEKNHEFNQVLNHIQSPSETINKIVAKSLVTLQNNWRMPAGELKHSGYFPSYHYEWFHGFWAWDSWKHAKAVAFFDTEKAKDQVRTMFDFQDSTGFIADCIYRDTAIERHNLRNTKPPLASWAVMEIYQHDKDIEFIREVYPKLKQFHTWWYSYRDHDQDGLCEYGSTDGSLIAAKWESGMDNAVRFDQSSILKNKEGAFSLNQESVDLNAYLYADKLYLEQLARILGKRTESDLYRKEAKRLKEQIQSQFYDTETGWFYDTSLDGTLIKHAMGCEGWIPLWANVASKQQAKAVCKNMMEPTLFYTNVPLQTLAANHPKFNPYDGYWRGPNWIDQSYFGVIGLLNYGYKNQANTITDRLIQKAEGITHSGTPFRENYHPITGEGLNAYNFSWTAGHYLLLILNTHE